MISNFSDGFKTVRIFPDDCQYSGWFQNCPDFSRWLPIFQIISKLSGFQDDFSGLFQKVADFLDDCQFSGLFQTVRIFPDDCQFSGLFQNCPDFSRWLPIFWMISKLSGFFQMTAKLPDYFKIVRVFPDADGNPQCRKFCLANQFLFRGEGVPKIQPKKLCKNRYFWSKKPFFTYFSPFWSILWPLWSIFNPI